MSGVTVAASCRANDERVREGIGYRVGGVGETYLEEERDERLDEENLENWTPDEHEHAAEAEIDQPEALLAVLVVRHDIRADDRVESGRGVETRRLGVCHLSLSGDNN